MSGESRGNALEVSVVMPCLNEAETLEVCIRKAMTCLDENGIAGEIVVADNGSTDGSLEIAARAGARIVSIESKGYGNALSGGIAAARGDLIIMGDADDSYDFANLMPFIEKLREGFDLVMGNRFKGGIREGAMPPLHKYLGNPVLTTIGRVFFHSDVGDFHCGLRGFRRDAIQRLNLRTEGMEFASEMIVKASLHGLRVTEVPTTLSPDGRSRPPHLRSWRDGWRHLRFMLLYSPRWLFLYPGAALILVGAALMAWLLPGSRSLAGREFDVHTLTYATAMIVIGFQAVLFAICTKVYAIGAGLLPQDRRLERVYRWVTLETGLLVGFGLLASGIVAALLSLYTWSGEGFGPLDPSSTLRLVIPATLLLTIGSQTILFSLFLSILGLRVRGNAFAETE
ncbi:MAG: glycosyltransferase family 2 protein [Thermoanaerobaculia bacterium]